jgi:hypothetical protein
MAAELQHLSPFDGRWRGFFPCPNAFILRPRFGSDHGLPLSLSNLMDAETKRLREPHTKKILSSPIMNLPGWITASLMPIEFVVRTGSPRCFAHVC